MKKVSHRDLKDNLANFGDVDVTALEACRKELASEVKVAPLIFFFKPWSRHCWHQLLANLSIVPRGILG